MNEFQKALKKKLNELSTYDEKMAFIDGAEWYLKEGKTL